MYSRGQLLVLTRPLEDPSPVEYLQLSGAFALVSVVSLDFADLYIRVMNWIQVNGHQGKTWSKCRL